MIYLPKGAAKAKPKVVQLFLLMFYPPGSKSEALQLGVHLILLYFVPRREMQSISSRGPIVFTFTLFGLVNVYYWTLTYKVSQIFETLKMF